MNIIRQIACLLLCLMLASPAVAETPAKSIDFAGQLRLNMASETAKTEVTVKTFVDGDTTHFHVPTSIAESGVLRARYLTVNTPEITGKVEEYGKKSCCLHRGKTVRRCIYHH